MEPAFLDYYNTELHYLRELGGEFAHAYPEIATRLGLEKFECADPYVERLLESFAFLTARLQLKIDAEFPELTHHLLEVIYPGYVAPMPSMLVARFEPDFKEPNLARGHVLRKNTELRSRIAPGQQTACEFRTSSDLTLWPLRLTKAEYLSTPDEIRALGVKPPARVNAGLRLCFQIEAGLKTDDLALNALPIYIKGKRDLANRLLEQIHARSQGFCIVGADGPAQYRQADAIGFPGFTDDAALLPVTERGFQGYRLLQEYFAFPEKFYFFELNALQDGLKQRSGDQFEVLLFFSQADAALMHAVNAEDFALFCVPAINLFQKTCDRVPVDGFKDEQPVIADRTRPQDFEIYSVESVKAYRQANDAPQEFAPLYGALKGQPGANRYYTVSREPGKLSGEQSRRGTRSRYTGSEIYIRLSDSANAPFAANITQLAVKALCTHRDLPLLMPLGLQAGDFTLMQSAPVKSVHCLTGPTPPRASLARSELPWRLINHLSQHYGSLLNGSETENAQALQALLSLYAPLREVGCAQQIEGVAGLKASPVVRKLPIPGPACVGRGLQIQLTLDENSFTGRGIFLLGKIMEEFFARMASINSFTETVLCSVQRGEIMRWSARLGRRGL